MLAKKYENYVRKLLTNIDQIYERQFAQGDYGATIMLIDLERAIKKAELTDRQVEAIRLVYFEGKSRAEVGRLKGIDRSVVSRHVNKGITEIAKSYEKKVKGGY